MPSSMNLLPTVDQRTHSSPRAGWLKPAVEYAIVVVMFLAALPVMLPAALLVKMTSRGPALYSQTRVGRQGRLFKIFKIRTMYHNCEAASGPKWASKNDDRVTFVGRILRKTHIDELPQLWNILRGDMNLVGPRPERPEFVGGLSCLIDRYEGRLAIKPGLTGLAQIQLPPDTNLHSVRKKLALDLAYVERRGLWLDLRLMVGTGLYLAGVSFNRIRSLLRLPKAAGLPALLKPEDEIDFSALNFPAAQFAFPVFAGNVQRAAPVADTEYAPFEGEVYS